MTDREAWDAGTGIDQLDSLIEEHVKAAVVDYISEQHGYFPNLYYPRDGGIGEKLPPEQALTFRCYLDEGLSAEKNFDLEAMLMEDIGICYEDGSYLEGLRRIAKTLARVSALASGVVALRDRVGDAARLDWHEEVMRDLLGETK